MCSAGFKSREFSNFHVAESLYFVFNLFMFKTLEYYSSQNELPQYHIHISLLLFLLG